MLPQDVRSEVDRIRSQFKQYTDLCDKSDFSLHPVYANYMVLKSAGFLESSIRSILAEYARRHSNQQIMRFLIKTVERENSLNCEKISKIICKLDSNIWNSVESKVEIESKEGVDSLKTIRDQVAHGKHNGTSIRTVSQYFENSLGVVELIGKEMLG